MQRINETKSWFFKKTNKTFIQTNQKIENIQINKIRNEKGDITEDNEKIL